MVKLCREKFAMNFTMQGPREISTVFFSDVFHRSRDALACLNCLLTINRHEACMRHVIFRFLICLSCLSGPVAPAEAEPYRLTFGDVVAVRVADGDPVALAIDVDGQIRLPQMAPVSLSGRTLEEAEAMLAKLLTATGLYVAPQVQVLVDRHAPLVVAGDVARPGRFDYTPGLTVAAALALAGGLMEPALRLDVDRARIEAQAQADALELAVATSSLRAARLEAALEPATPLPALAALDLRLPRAPAIDADALWRIETALFEEDRRRVLDMLASWDAEAAALEQQETLFARRITAQQDIVDSVGRELAAAQALGEKGLQTITRLERAEQRDADARARVLELEAARMTALRGLAEIRRERTAFLAARRDRLLTDLSQTLVTRDDQRLRLNRARTLLTLLDSGPASLRPDALRVVVQSPRAGRDGMASRDLTLPLLPGDILLVQTRAPDPGTGG